MISKEQMGFAIRTFGVGGLFGYFGYFSSKNQGSMLWYATQREKFVMIHLEGNKIVLTRRCHKFCIRFNTLVN
jgi:hypothetical protein